MEHVIGMFVMITITVTALLLITIINIVMATLEVAQKCQEIEAAVGSRVMMI